MSYWTHARVSYLKSAVRIAACLAGVWSFAAFCIGFALAEGLGVWEELGERGGTPKRRRRRNPCRGGR